MAVIPGLTVVDLALFNGGPQASAISSPCSMTIDYQTGFLAGNATGFGVGLYTGRGHGMAIANAIAESSVDEGSDLARSSGIGVGMAIANAIAESNAEESDAIARSSGIGAGLALAARVAEQDAEEAFEDGYASAAPVFVRTGMDSVPEEEAPVAETDPPEIGTVSPDAGVAPGGSGFPATYAAAQTVPIQIPVVDDESDIAFVVISLRYPGHTVWETVYSGAPGVEGTGAFKPGWTVSSALAGDGSPAVGFTFDILPDGGWPAFVDDYSIEVDPRAVDSTGNVL